MMKFYVSIVLLFAIVPGLAFADTNECSYSLQRRIGFFTWTETCLQPKANLQGIDLRGIRLENISLEEADLRGARLDGVRLSKVNLKGAILDGASLQGAILNDVDLSWASLESADLRGAQLIDSDFSYANMQGADFGPIPGYAIQTETLGSIFTETNLSGAKLK